jgi:hypothetical protein
MPHLVFYALIGVVAWYGYKTFKREAERVSARVRRTEEETRNRAAGTLVEDPETGEYWLKRD